MKNQLSKKIFIWIALAAIIYLLFLIWADYRIIIKAFKEINLFYIPLILGLVLVNYLLRFLKWDYYLKTLKIKVKKSDSFFIFFSGLSMSITPGKMGELLKCYLLKKTTKTPMSYSSSVIIAERITDFISLIIICIAGAYYAQYGREAVLACGALFIIFVLLLSSKKTSLKIISLLENIKFLEKYIKKIHIAYESTYELIKIKPLLITVIISLIGWCSECLGFYMIFSSFAVPIEIPILLASFIYAFSTLFGALLLVPGGLGITEGSMTGLLVLLGKISLNYSFTIMFIGRAATLWFAVFIGSLALLYYQKKIHIPKDEIENFNQEKNE